MRSAVLALLTTGLTGLCSGGVSAQDMSASATHGEVRLKGGFVPDPHEIELKAGGKTKIDRSECTYGFVADAPAIDFYYEGDGSRTLYLDVVADEETVLLINDPDAEWACAAIADEGSKPLLIIPEADSGLYNIWVGTRRGDPVPVTLRISEMDPRR